MDSIDGFFSVQKNGPHKKPVIIGVNGLVHLLINGIYINILGLEPTDPITFDPNFLGNPTSYNWGEISLDYK